MPNNLPIKERNSSFNPFRWIRDFVKGEKVHNWIEKFMSIVIVVDLLLFGVNTFQISDSLSYVVSFLNIAIQVIFIMDCLYIILNKGKDIYHDGWAVSDILITLITLIPIGEWSQYSRIIRSIRVIRCIRVFSHVKELKELIGIIGKSTVGVLWTIVLLLLFMYCYGIVGTLMFGIKFDEWFGSLWKSIYTLFQIITMEAWSDSIARAVMEEFPNSWIYFVSFVIISAFIVMNIVIGIIVDTITQTHMNEKEKQLKEMLEDQKKKNNIFPRLRKSTEYLISYLKSTKSANSTPAPEKKKEKLKTEKWNSTLIHGIYIKALKGNLGEIYKYKMLLLC